MPLAKQTDIEDVNSLGGTLGLKVFGYILQAEEHVRKKIGHLKYEEIRDDSTEEYYARLKRAEALYCFAIAIPCLNMRITEQGGMIQATGFNESRNQLASKRELDKYQRDIYAQADNLIRALIYGLEHEET